MKEEPKFFYVYILFDWLGTPRYVGKSKYGSNRENKHEKYTDAHNQLKNEFIEQTWIILNEIPKLRVQEYLTEAQAFESEKALIKAIGRIDLNTGPLTNLTDGGEGMSGYCYSDFSKRLISIGVKNWAAGLSPEIRSEFARRSHKNQTSEERSAIVSRGHLKRSKESYVKSIIAMIEALNAMTPEQRSAIGRIGGKSAKPGQRSASAKLFQANRSPEERNISAKKS